MEKNCLAKIMKHKKEYATALVFLLVLVLFFAMFAIPMGIANAFNTMMNTAYSLLVNTALFIVAITTLMGAIASLLDTYNVVKLLNTVISPLMKPLYGMPGAAALGVVTTYLSDNPAILTLAENREYKSCFRKYQIPALTNLGTAFGMGLIVTSFVIGMGKHEGLNAGAAALCGNLGAVAGSVLSTRLMLRYTSRILGKDSAAVEIQYEAVSSGVKSKPSFLDSIMNGGKAGMELGLSALPGIVIICTIVMMLTYGTSGGVYSGNANEGIALIPTIAGKLSFILTPLFGFSSAECIAVPITALGSAGAALGMIPMLVSTGQAGGNDLAVFTAMCMCWSGYLSTHVSMMDVLHCREYTGKAILFHTLGGMLAGFVAHVLYSLLF